MHSALVRELEAQLPGLLSIYLFGSAATGDAHRESDIDLAVLCERSIDPIQRWKLQEHLAALAHQDVDLVDLRRASTVLQAQVLEHGRLLLDRDVPARAAFEMFVLSSYARLNEERRGILADIAARGSVY